MAATTLQMRALLINMSVMYLAVGCPKRKRHCRLQRDAWWPREFSEPVYVLGLATMVPTSGNLSIVVCNNGLDI